MDKNLSEIRTKLAQARIGLRYALDSHETERALAEQRAIDRAVAETGLVPDKALGTNTESRQRGLLLALNEDATYQDALERSRDAQDDVDGLQADLDSLLDGRREAERLTRDKFADALLASSRSLEHLLDDADATADAIADRLVDATLASGGPAVDLPEDDPTPTDHGRLQAEQDALAGASEAAQAEDAFAEWVATP